MGPTSRSTTITPLGYCAAGVWAKQTPLDDGRPSRRRRSADVDPTPGPQSSDHCTQEKNAREVMGRVAELKKNQAHWGAQTRQIQQEVGQFLTGLQAEARGMCEEMGEQVRQGMHVSADLLQGQIAAMQAAIEQQNQTIEQQNRIIAQPNEAMLEFRAAMQGVQHRRHRPKLK